jgi:hypothetical protein
MLRLRALLVTFVLVAGACQSTPAPTPGPTGAAATLPDATQVASVTQEPSAAPVDVAAKFATQITAATKGSMTMTGSLEVGEQIGNVTGKLTFVGGDSLQSTTVTLAGKTSTTQTVRVGFTGWTKIGDGPWFQDAVAPKLGQDLRTVLKGLSGLVDKGVEQHDNVSAHRIELPAGTVLAPAQFGLTDPKIVSPTVALVFYADDTGKPLAMVLTVQWSQTVSGVATPVTMTLDFTINQLDGPLVVAPPDDVWGRYTSKRFHYTLGYPGEWSTYLKDKSYDYFESSSDPFVGVGRFKSSGFTLNVWAKETIAYDKAHYKASNVSNVAYKLAGVTARYLTMYVTIKSKVYILYEVLAIKGGYVYDVYWQSPKGFDTANLAAFNAILATFAYA